MSVFASIYLLIWDSKKKDQRLDESLKYQAEGLKNQANGLEAQVNSLKEQVTSLQTQALRDFNAELFNIDRWLVEHPKCFKLISKKTMSDEEATERAFAFYIMNVFCHAHDMHEKNTMTGKDWDCNLGWMVMIFKNGTLKDYWLNDEEFPASYDKAFRDFVQDELINPPEAKEQCLKRG